MARPSPCKRRRGDRRRVTPRHSHTMDVTNDGPAAGTEGSVGLQQNVCFYTGKARSAKVSAPCAMPCPALPCPPELLQPGLQASHHLCPGNQLSNHCLSGIIVSWRCSTNIPGTSSEITWGTTTVFGPLYKWPCTHTEQHQVYSTAAMKMYQMVWLLVVV